MTVTVIGHRGARVEAPENTLQAFELAVDAGADMIELDVHLSKDGRVVIMHDPSIDRMTDMTGNIAEMTWDELRKAKVGGEKWPDSTETIPSLEEALEVCARGGIAINIEIKGSGDNALAVADAVVKIVRRDNFPTDAILVSCFDWEVLRYFVSEYPEYPLASLFKKEPGPLEELPGKVIHPEIRLVDGEFMREAKAAGKTVNVWTLNDPEQWKQAIALGADGITTDDPRGLRKLLQDMQ